MGPIQWRTDTPIACSFFFSWSILFLELPQLMEILWKGETPEALGERKRLSGANFAQSHGLWSDKQ